jgi:glucose-1-phosphate cytidylyltransferase
MPKIQKNNIPVVILCGGKGTRLKEETEMIPKPLVRIGDKPILWHIMKLYSAYGFRHFILPVGYKGEKIKEYFLNYNALRGDFTIDFEDGQRKIIPHTSIEDTWKVTIVDTGLNTETGARIKRIKPYITSETFLLTYGDGVSDINVNKLLKFHLTQGTTATVTGVHPPARFGEIAIKNKLAVGFWEKQQLRQGYINGGFFALNKNVFNFLKGDDPYVNFERDILPKIAKSRELSVFCHSGFWQCMDTLRDMEYLNEIWATGNIPWKIWQA